MRRGKGGLKQWAISHAAGGDKNIAPSRTNGPSESAVSNKVITILRFIAVCHDISFCGLGHFFSVALFDFKIDSVSAAFIISVGVLCLFGWLDRPTIKDTIGHWSEDFHVLGSWTFCSLALRTIRCLMPPVVSAGTRYSLVSCWAFSIT